MLRRLLQAVGLAKGLGPGGAKPSATRSPHWPAVRKIHLAKEPSCQACGAEKSLEVHHIHPFHLFPALELTDSNLITLCEGDAVNCHFLYGHLRSWKSYNGMVRRDATEWLRKIKERP